MIRHIVVWRIKEGPGREASLEAIRERLLGLKSAITQIRALEAGINVTPGPDAADVLLYSEFDSLEDLAAYQRHPEHLRFVEFMAPLKAEKRVLDHEF
jgi:hypothetical protein